MQKKYFAHLQKRFPQLENQALELVSDKLISPYTVTLPKAVLEQADKVVKQLFELRSRPAYKESLKASIPAIGHRDPGNKSICMSYDFHLDASGNLKLIEINTNAAFLLMGHLLYDCEQKPQPVPDFSLEEIFENCKTEARLADQPLSAIGIVDETPSSQRLYIEFLLYQQLFREFGLQAEIYDPSQLQIHEGSLQAQGKKLDFIYNRTTDFYFTTPGSATLQQAYEQELATFSPNPHEYTLLADKQRLIDWSLQLQSGGEFASALEPIKDYLLTTSFLNDANSAEIWANKKKYFFKPLTSFGSKGSYRGEGISRPYFEQLLKTECLAQEYCPPAESIFEAKEFPATKLKYDLRFYAYQDRIQTVIARLYQGQVTNLRTPHGGFATVVFT